LPERTGLADLFKRRNHFHGILPAVGNPITIQAASKIIAGKNSLTIAGMFVVGENEPVVTVAGVGTRQVVAPLLTPPAVLFALIKV
jgi:hypothetical protein